MDDASTFEESADHAAERAVRFGVGPVPLEVDRLNWSAVLWGALWALVYGVWPWFWTLVALDLVATIISVSIGRSTASSASAPATIAVYSLTTLLMWAPSVYFGFVANRVLWERRAQRPASGEPPTVEAFLRTQRTWAVIGLAWVGLGWVRSALVARGPSMFSELAVASSVAATILVLAGMWLWSRSQAAE